MPTPRQTGIVRACTEAFTKYLEQRTVGVAMITADGVGVGTGTCINVADRYFIATAAHVVAGVASEDLRFVTQQAAHDGVVPIRARGSRGGGDFDAIDIAWLEIDRPVAAGLGRVFVDGARARCHCVHLETDLAFVFGYPDARLQRTRLRDGHTWLDFQPVGRSSSTVDQMPMIGREDCDLFINWPDEGISDTTGRPVQPTDPRGISGASVWALHINAEGFWTPESAVLVGVQHS